MPEARRTRGRHTERLTSTIQKKPSPNKAILTLSTFSAAVFSSLLSAHVFALPIAREEAPEGFFS